MNCKPLLALIVASLLLVSPSLADDKCRCLSLAGGGDKGAYQAGALQRLAELKGNEVDYDIVAGVAVGALNSAWVGLSERGNMKDTADKLVGLWENISQKAIYKSWFGGIAQGVLFEKGIYNNAPVYDFVDEALGDMTVHRKLSIGAVDANAGSFLTFNYTIGPQPELLKLEAAASTSMPAVFPYLLYEDMALIEGGSVFSNNVVSCINLCAEEGYEEENMIIDILMSSSNANVENEEALGYTSIQHALRWVSLSSYFNGARDLTDAITAHPNVNFRHLVAPSKKLPSGMLPLDFNSGDIKKMIEQGRQDVDTVTSLPEGEMLKIWLDIYHEKEAGELLDVPTEIERRSAELLAQLQK